MNDVIKSLRKMHSIERLATEIYRSQLWIFSQELLIKRIKAASENEQEHIESLYARIVELGGKKSSMSWSFKLAGKILGFCTTLLGKRLVFKFDIAVEKKAVTDYTKYLNTVNFDDASRKILEKNLEDEKLHIKRWEDSLQVLRGKHTAFSDD
ncbi:MAG: demethoxyubiquinone hydroxylase family protein [Chloroflexi bacterium]|nr:demethoxyubiquinone hydroxylase family protein [Chloroflexota bacterium]